jgi:hypothetical protein
VVTGAGVDAADPLDVDPLEVDPLDVDADALPVVDVLAVVTDALFEVAARPGSLPEATWL